MSSIGRATVAILLGGVAFAGGWFLALDRIPYRETDKLFAQMRAGGFADNRLRPARLRSAKRNIVPMDNADTLTRAAILDLSQGPLLFTARTPGKAAEYWSVSVFSHNTDTAFVRNDTQVPPRQPLRLAIRRSDQQVPDGLADAEAVLPSDSGFLIVRATVADRNDTRATEGLKAALAEHDLSPLEATVAAR